MTNRNKIVAIVLCSSLLSAAAGAGAAYHLWAPQIIAPAPDVLAGACTVVLAMYKVDPTFRSMIHPRLFIKNY